jgi:hypothetical protein
MLLAQHHRAVARKGRARDDHVLVQGQRVAGEAFEGLAFEHRVGADQIEQRAGDFHRHAKSIDVREAEAALGLDSGCAAFELGPELVGRAVEKRARGAAAGFRFGDGFAHVRQHTERLRWDAAHALGD